MPHDQNVVTTEVWKIEVPEFSFQSDSGMDIEQITSSVSDLAISHSTIRLINKITHVHYAL